MAMKECLSLFIGYGAFIEANPQDLQCKNGMVARTGFEPVRQP